MFAEITRMSTPAVRLASDLRYKGSWTATAATVKPTAAIARTQRRAQMSKAADTGAQSMRYGDSAAVITVTWFVIGKYRDAKAQPAMTSATTPIAVWSTLRIFDNIVQYPSSARVGKARRAGAAAARMARTASRRRYLVVCAHILPTHFGGNR